MLTAWFKATCQLTATASLPLSNAFQVSFWHRCHETEGITDSLKQFGINKCLPKCFSDDFGGQMVGARYARLA